MKPPKRIKRIKRSFVDFVNMLDTKSEYYIFKTYIKENDNENRKENRKENINETGKENINETGKINTTETKNEISKYDNSDRLKKDDTISIPINDKKTTFVAKNADHVPLPAPRDNPESIYNVSNDIEMTGDATDAGDSSKFR